MIQNTEPEITLVLQENETAAIGVPVSMAAAETDSLLTPEKRSQLETIMRDGNKTYQVSLYSGTSHGFGVRANISNPIEKFGKESAFLQAVRWFQTMAYVSDFHPISPKLLKVHEEIDRE